MKRISMFVVISLMFATINDSKIAGFKDSKNGNWNPRILQSLDLGTENKPDTLCLKCMEDSIVMTLSVVMRDVAKLDSISRRVRMNTLKITENNQTIHLILTDCATAGKDSAVQPLNDSTVQAFQDTTIQELPPEMPSMLKNLIMQTDSVKKNYYIEVKKK